MRISEFVNSLYLGDRYCKGLYLLNPINETKIKCE